MEGCSFQRCPCINPNPNLFEYKIKTGRSWPITNSEMEVYNTWYKTTHGYRIQEEACKRYAEISQETFEESEEDTFCWESWHPACSFEDD
jgi:hypothetical protein